MPHGWIIRRIPHHTIGFSPRVGRFSRIKPRDCIRSVTHCASDERGCAFKACDEPSTLCPLFYFRLHSGCEFTYRHDRGCIRNVNNAPTTRITSCYNVSKQGTVQYRWLTKSTDVIATNEMGFQVNVIQRLAVNLFILACFAMMAANKTDLFALDIG